jgi:hypothetical protein
MKIVAGQMHFRAVTGKNILLKERWKVIPYVADVIRIITK